MTLWMVQCPLDLGRLVRWATRESLLPARGDSDLGYALHAALTAAFGDMAPKPFALQHRSTVSLLGYSPHDGTSLRARAQLAATPEVYGLLDVDRLADKIMPERFAAGQRLGFSVRARPMLRTDAAGDRNRTVEKDAFLMSPPNSNRGDVYSVWLAQQFEAGGAAAERIVLDAFQLTRVQRRGADRGFRRPRGPDATFSGILRVNDPEAFARSLARGIGRHRTFGFGMLLLRPA